MKRLKLIRSLLCLGMAALSLRAAAELPQRESICLNGIWQAIAVSSRDAVIPQGEWGEVRVPFCYGAYEDQHFNMPPGMTADNGAVWFTRSLPVPSEWADGRRVRINYQAIFEAHAIFVNGKPVHSAPGARYCTRVDITDAVKFGGDNVITVQTIRPTFGIEWSGYTRDLGITRDIYLECVPAADVEYVLVTPSVAKKELNVRFGVTNAGKKAVNLPLNAEVLGEDGNPALALPEQTVQLNAGESREISVTVPWQDPVLWGFADYGKPYLYKLRTSFGRDERFDRFGFREFTSKGSDFYLNGKKIFLKGDLISRYTIFYEHPAAFMVHFQRLASAGMNFLRLHGYRYDSHCWYEVADETGFLMEAQSRYYSDGAGLHTPDSDVVKENWRNYIRENYNHPSIILWSVDNESFHMDDVNEEKMHQFDRLISFVKTIDPARIVEIHHGYALYPYAVKGQFKRENFQTFNIHPYGSLQRAINSEIRKTGFKLEVPVVVGEVFANLAHRNYVKDPSGCAAEEWRAGDSYYTQITDAARAKGVASIVLCSLEADGFIGFDEGRQLRLGPWGDRALKFDADGQPVEMKRERVRMRWPSVSGTGVHADMMLTYEYDGGVIMHNMNWFDPKAPYYTPSLVAVKARQAFDTIPNGPVPQWSTRHPEVIVLLPPEAAGSVVKVCSLTTGETKSVASDPKASAWFRLDAVGFYEAEYTQGGNTQKQMFAIDEFPKMSPTPGYDYLTFVEFAPNLAEKLRAELNAPTEFLYYDTLRRDEILENNEFSMWTTPSRCSCWNAGGPVEKIVPGYKNSTCAIQISNARKAIVQNFPALTAGARYRVSGAVRKDAGAGIPAILITDKQYKVKFKLPGSQEIGKWVEVSGEFTADGTETTIFGSNEESAQASSFDRLSLRKIAEPEKPVAEKEPEGPFAVSPDGFIRDFLALGPLPNMKQKNHFTGMDMDILKFKPELGKVVAVEFPEGSYWKAGKFPIAWRSLHSQTDIVDLCVLRSPANWISSSQPCYVCAILYAEVISPEKREAQLAIGSDDGYQLYLNGRKIGEFMDYRGATADSERYPVTLEKGRNTLVFSVLQFNGGWSTIVRFLYPDGKPVTDLKINLPQKQ